MNVVNNLIKLQQLLPLNSTISFKKRVYQQFTPRLWGTELVKRASLEGEITETIRSWTSFDNEKSRWKTLFTHFFKELEVNHQKHLSILSIEEKTALYSLRPKEAPTDPKATENTIIQLKKFLRENDVQLPLKPKPQEPIPIHWTQDPKVIHQLSLLRNEEPGIDEHVDGRFINELFNINSCDALYEDPVYFAKVIAAIKKRVGTEAPIHLLQQAMLIEERLQRILSTSKKLNDHKISLSELKQLATQISSEINELKVGEKWFFFGGIPLRYPQLNVPVNSNGIDVTYFLNQFCNSKASEEWTRTVTEFFATESKNLYSSHVSDETHEKLQEIFTKGLISALLPSIRQSLLNPEQNLAVKALLTIPELLRMGTDKALTIIEETYINDITKNYKGIPDELRKELLLAFEENRLEEFLKTYLAQLLSSSTEKAHRSLILQFVHLSSELPSLVTDLMAALGYGELGSPEAPYFFEFERQANEEEPYTLILYNAESPLPLKYSGITSQKLDSDLFLRFLTFRVEMEWNSKARFTTADIHRVLTEKLQSTPTLIEDLLETLQDNPQKLSRNWKLIQSYLKSHISFASTKERIQFFFHWKRDALISFYKDIKSKQASTFDSRSDFLHASLAAEALAKEALAHFESGMIDIEELRTIYATTEEILIDSRPSITILKAKNGKDKSELLPPEITSLLLSIFQSCGSQNAGFIKKLFIDALGPQVEDVLDSLLVDFQKTDLTFPPSPISDLQNTFTFYQFGQKSFRILLNATIGINLEDITSPTFFSCLKIAVVVTRIGLSCLFPSLAISLNFKWAITILAKEAIFEVAQHFFPESLRQLKRMEEKLNEWKFRLFLKAFSKLLLSSRQQDAINLCIQKWANYLTSSIPLSFEIAPLNPYSTVPKFTLHKIKPLLSPFPSSVHPRPPSSKFVFTKITGVNCISILESWNKILKEGVLKKADLHEKALYCLEKMKSLPVPSSKCSTCWNEVNDPLRCLEAISELARQLYMSAGEALCSTEISHQSLIQLYKSYAIIDVLARQCPGSNLDGFKSNPWALALLKDDIHFHVFDPQVRKEIVLICQYFDIDYDKRYTLEEIESMPAVLFQDHEKKQNNYNSTDVYSPTLISQTIWNGLGNISQRIFGGDPGFGYKAPLGNAEQYYYQTLLETPRVQQLLKELELQDAHILEQIGAVMADKEQIFLSRAFHLLRLAGNLFANDFTSHLVKKRATLNITSLEYSPVGFNLRENYIESAIAAAPFVGNILGSLLDSKAWKYLPGNYANIVTMGCSDAANACIASPLPSDSLTKSFLFLNNFNPSLVTDPQKKVLASYLHQKPRPQNKIINDPASFTETRNSSKSLISNSVKFSCLNAIPLKISKAQESFWAEKEDQIVRVLSYFSLNIGGLFEKGNLYRLHILLLRGTLLDKQLKEHPPFLYTLGAFFEKTFQHPVNKDNISEYISLMHLATLCLTIARSIHPEAEAAFPNLSETLWNFYHDFYPLYYVSFFDLKLIGLSLVTPYLYIDPLTATSKEKEQACIDCCRFLLVESSYSERDKIYKEIFKKWLPTIEEVLTFNSPLRNKILNEIAYIKALNLPKEANWEPNFPLFTCGHVQLKLAFDLATVLDEELSLEPIIRHHLTSIYGTHVPKIEKVNRSEYEIKKDNIHITVKALKSGGITLKITKKNGESLYRLVSPDPLNTDLPIAPKQSYWLKKTPRETSLLIAKKGKISLIRGLEAEKGQFYFSEYKHFSEKVKIDLKEEAPGLLSLVFFQPLSSIEVYQNSNGIEEIVFSALNLSFRVSEIKGQQVAHTSEIPDYYICRKQKQDQLLPVLKNYSQYLLLENSEGHKKVILPSASIRTSIASWIVRKTTGINSSCLMEQYFSQFFEKFGKKLSLENGGGSLYHVYGIDKQGRLTSEDPEALLQLLFYSLSQEELTDIHHYLTLLEGIGLRSLYPPAVFKMIETFEGLSLISFEPLFQRIALRLAAIKEKNQLNQMDMGQSSATKTQTLLSWISLQINYTSNNTQNKDKLPDLPFDEYQEYYVLHSIVRKGKELLSTDDKNSPFAGNETFEGLINTVGKDFIAKKLMMLPQLVERYEFLAKKYAVEGETSKSQFKEFIQHILPTPFTTSFSSNTEDSPKQIENTQRMEAIQLLTEFCERGCLPKLMDVLPWIKEEIIIRTYLNKLVADLALRWKTLPLHFTNLSHDTLKENFHVYYQLAYGELPLKYKEVSQEANAFYARSEELRKSLQLAIGSTPEEKLLIQILKAVTNSSRYLFPNPQTLETKLHSLLQKNIIFKEAKAQYDSLSYSDEWKWTPEQKTISANFSNAMQYLNEVEDEILQLIGKISIAHIGALTFDSKSFSLVTQGLQAVGKKMALNKLKKEACSAVFSMTENFLPPQVKLAISAGTYVYRGVQAIEYLIDQNEKIKSKHVKIQEEREKIDLQNNRVEAPVSTTSRAHFIEVDNAFGSALKELLFLTFSNSVDQETPDEMKPLPTLKSPSTDAFIEKRFAAYNQSISDYAGRDAHEHLPEKIQSIESYNKLKLELEKGKQFLKKTLKKERKALFISFQQKPSIETRSDEVVISERIKRSQTQSLAEYSLTSSGQFDALLKAFINDHENDIMRHTGCNSEDLPKVKDALYLYLIKATRLQQIERALELLQEINPNLLEEEEMQVRQKQLSFELGRPRAFEYQNPPAKMLRGYLAFEHGTKTMLWDETVDQLQRMLLEDHYRSILELITGSGKTFFGTPMISFYASNQKQVVHNCFPDSLFFENTKDLSSRLYEVYGKFAHGIKISRKNRPNVDQLWSLLRTHIEAFNLGQPLNSCKKDLQALELLFIEEAYLSSKKRRPGDEQLLLYYMKLLHFIRTKEKGNIDEAHRLFQYNNELNHPFGERKGLKQSSINVISECMRLLATTPEIIELLPLEDNEQTFCSSETYHDKIKPQLAQNLIRYFKIPPENQKQFLDYLCDHATEIPAFMKNLTAPHQKGIALARGVLNILLPDALRKKVNVHFGIEGNPYGYAQPYSSKDTPIVGSTFKNPYEATVKTLMAYLHLELTTPQIFNLIARMRFKANAESTLKKISFEKTSFAKLFRSWTSSELNNPDYTRIVLLSKNYAARLTYARLFPISEIKYYAENLCSDSQNYASMFAGFYGETASPSIEEVCPTGSTTLWKKGTAGEFLHFVSNTCTEKDITVIENREPQQALQEILGLLFGPGSTNTALIDTGAYFYGLTNESVARTILAHVNKTRSAEILGVVYFNEDNKLVILEHGKMPQSLSSSSIPPKNRISYFPNSHIFGADIKQAIGAGGVLTISEDTDFERSFQGSGRMRGLKKAKQSLHFVTNSAVKKLLTDQEQVNIQDINTHTICKEAESQKLSVFPSTQKQMANVTRRAILDKMIESNDVNSMLAIMREFTPQLITKTVVDPRVLYGTIRIDVPTKEVAVPQLRKQQLAIVVANNNLHLFSEEQNQIRIALEEVGKNSTFAPTVKLAKSEDGHYLLDDLNITQEVDVSLDTEVAAEISNDQSKENEQEMEMQQNQNLDLNLNNDITSENSDLKLRIRPARWNPTTPYTTSLDWWEKIMGPSDANHQKVEVYSVSDALANSSSSLFAEVNKAFKGLYWTNNLQGILISYGISILAEPLTKKPILELLVIQSEDGSIRTCAIDQKDGVFWREYLNQDQISPTPHGSIKIGIFDLGLNTFVLEGKNQFDQKTLQENETFNFDIVRWKFLAAHVTLISTEKGIPLIEKFERWLLDNNCEKMRACYLAIYEELGFLNLKDSQIEQLFFPDANAFKDIG